jgi:hypothetical protein
MTIEEMLWAMTDVDSTTGKVRISKEAARAIGEVLKAAQAIKQREKIGGYGHEGIPDLLAALAHLEEDV